MDMKKVICLLFIATLATWEAQLRAQMYNSRDDIFSNLSGGDAIVRSNPVNGKSIVYYTDASTGYGHFIYHDSYSVPSPANATVYDLPIRMTNDPTAIGTTIKITVNDIVLTDTRCYFCGQFYFTHYQSPYEGIVGCLDLTEFSTPSTGFSLLRVTSTSELYRMDVYKNGVEDYIAIVGRLSPNNQSCITFATFNSPSSSSDWNYSTIPSVADEVFTDISFADDGAKVVAVSRLDNENYRFCLRCEACSNAFPLFSFSDFAHRKEIDTQVLTYSGSGNPSPTYHENDVDIRLDKIPGTASVVVGYECYDGTQECEPGYNVALFTADFANFHSNRQVDITSQQIVSGYYDRPGTLQDMKYSLQYGSVALLLGCKDCDEDLTTVAMFPELGVPGSVDALRTAYQLHTSLDWTPDDDIVMAGTQPDGEVIHFYQSGTDLENSCYLTQPKARSEILEGEPTITETHNTFTPSSPDLMDYTASPFAGTATPYQTNCITFKFKKQ